MDSQGPVFVADRGNSRIQIFDREGNLLAIWTQFGKPSGLVIDRDDILYAVDGLSGSKGRMGIYSTRGIGAVLEYREIEVLPFRKKAELA